MKECLSCGKLPTNRYHYCRVCWPYFQTISGEEFLPLPSLEGNNFHKAQSWYWSVSIAHEFPQNGDDSSNAAVSYFLDSLPDELKTIALMNFSKVPKSEIARALNWSRGTIRNRLAVIVSSGKDFFANLSLTGGNANVFS